MPEPGVEITESSAHPTELSGTGYVTGRAFQPLVAVGDEKGWSQEELLEDLPLTEETVRSTRGRVPWPMYAAYAERFEEKLGDLDEVKSVLVPTYVAMAKFLGLMASSRVLYTWVNRVAGPSIFPAVEHETTELDSTTLRVDLRIPDKLVDCPTFFRITGLMLQQAPLFLGDRPAAVDVTISPRHGKYIVRLPPSSTIWARLKRAFRALFSGAAVLDELVLHHDRLLESHAELQVTHQELERSEANFRTLIEQTPEGVVVINDDRVAYANDAMRTFLACEDGSLDNELISKFLVDPEALTDFQFELEASGTSGAEIEFRNVDGEIVVGEVKAIEVEWNGREALLLVAADVTERNRIMDRAMQLDRMIAVGTLAAGVAHEINNPLAFVHSNLEYAIEALDELQDQVEDSVTKRLVLVREALDESVNGTDRVRDIVRDLKSFSREPDEARLRVDLREVIKSAINMGWHEVRTTAKLRTEYADVPPVLATNGRLGQVVLNLVVNAAQAMPDRHKDHNFITIRTLAGEDRGMIEVEDNGIGIPHENIRRIFDPFFTTKELGEGTGLGLWISNSIITKLGGEMTVESEVGRGTLFRIELPYAAAVDAEGPPELDVEISPADLPSEADEEPIVEPEVEQPVSTPTYRRSGDRRVMVVDDEPMILRLVERVLPDEVVSFADPHEAMRHLRDDEDFDVVVCDATMPGMNGREFFVRLKAEYPALARRFLLVTGGLTTSWEGGDDPPRILTKPFNMEKLRSTVREVDAEAEHLEAQSAATEAETG